MDRNEYIEKINRLEEIEKEIKKNNIAASEKTKLMNEYNKLSEEVVRNSIV